MNLSETELGLRIGYFFIGCGLAMIIYLILVYGIKWVFGDGDKAINKIEVVDEEEMTGKPKPWSAAETRLAAIIALFYAKDQEQFIERLAKDLGRTSTAVNRKIIRLNSVARGAKDTSSLDRVIFQTVRTLDEASVAKVFYKNLDIVRNEKFAQQHASA